MSTTNYTLPAPLYQWQNDHLNRVSRTFALSIEYLPQPLETYTSLQYLICRVPDTIEDASHIEPSTKKSLLNTYEDVLHRGKRTNAETFVEEVQPFIQDDDSDWQLVAETPQLIELLRDFPPEVQTAITPWARELTRGMAEYVSRDESYIGVRIRDLDDLEEYCYYVAGTVGHMIIDTLTAVHGDGGIDTTELHYNARRYGLFLQHINIAKDVYDDFEAEDSVYIPASVLEEYDVDQESVTDSDKRSLVANSIETVLDTAEEFIDGAERFLQQVQHISDDSYTGWSIPYVLAVATIREIRENTEEAADEGSVKIERDEVIALVTALDEGEHAASEIREMAKEQQFQ